MRRALLAVLLFGPILGCGREPQTTEVLVARADFSQWTPLHDPESMFELKKLPKDQLSATYVPPVCLAEIRGQPLCKVVRGGQVLCWEDVQPPAIGKQPNTFDASRQPAAAEARIEVLIARRDINDSTQLREPGNLLDKRTFLSKGAPATTVPPVRIGEVRRIMPLRQGQVLCWENVSYVEKEAPLPPDKRAYAIEASPRTATGNFILPGEYIDILQISRNGDQPILVVENVPVWAVMLVPLLPDDGKTPYIIAALSVEQVRKLHALGEKPDLRVILRPSKK
jgi:hypothetical protein